MSTQNKIGVVLMTYGSANTSENVEAYFKHIYKNPSREVIEDFKQRYDVVGGSPLVRITKEQASLLEKRLGKYYVVRAGMRHSTPFIDEAIKESATEGATSLVGIILSPQFSSFIMDGYKKDFSAGAKKYGITQTTVAAPWPTEEHFVELLAKRVSDKLSQLGSVPVVCTTHSLPQRAVKKDPSYLSQ